MAIDWKRLEDLLVTQGEKALAELAKAHANETFYAAMFSVEAYDGVFVHILLNTREHLLAKTSKENADKPHYKYLPGGFAHTLRITKAIDGWGDFDDAIVEATDEDMDEERTNTEGMWMTSGKLIEAVCRAAVRLEQSGFTKLQRTPDFAIGVNASMHEPGDMSVDRYKKFKSKTSLSAPAGR